MSLLMTEFRHETVLRSILLNAPHDQLWSLSDPNVVWDYQENARRNELDLFEQFFKHVVDCIEIRMKRTKVPAFNPAEEGRWLRFNPYHSLFEDVAIEATNGFFGSGDCPPPAFWTHVEVDALVSFIPQRYVDTASIGVDVCVNDTLEWRDS